MTGGLEFADGPVRVDIPDIEDIDRVLSNIRPEDRRDMELLGDGRDCAEIVLEDVQSSGLVLALYYEGYPCVLFGVIPLDTGIGGPWLVASSRADSHAVCLARKSKILLDFIQREYPLLVTWVCAENRRSLAWHRWCGFSFEGREAKTERGVFLQGMRRIK